MNRMRNLINLGIICLIMILALALTACNPASQAAPEPDKVSLQLNWIFQSQFAGFFVAQQEGLYRAENLEVDIIPGSSTFDPLSKVVSKEADFALLTDPTQVLQAREAGEGVVAVAILYQQNPNVWISLAEKNITRAQDMVGKKIGVRPVGDFAYRLLLGGAGIERDQVKDNEVVLEDFTIRPVIDGEVDVALDFALDGPLVAARQGYKLNVITLADVGVVLPSQALVVHEDLLAANPDLVRRFVRATLKGWETAVNDLELGLKATLQFDETLDVTHQTDMMAATAALVDAKTTPVGHMDEETWQQIMQLALDQKVISGPVELDKVYTTEFLK